MKLKKIAIAMLAFSMALTQLPVVTYAAKSDDVKTVIRPAGKAKRESVNGEAIVLFTEGYTKTANKNAAKAAKLTKDITIKSMYDFSNEDGKAALTGTSGIGFGDYVVAVVKSKTLSTEELIKELKKNKNVKEAEPNYIVHAADLGDYTPYQWALNNKGQNGGKEGLDLNADYVWNKGKTGTDRVIAIIDTGVDYTHPDLQGKMWKNPFQARLAGTCGYDFVNNDGDPLDDNGHGTHCSGIMAAATEKNSVGVSGVNQKAQIMALKFLDAEGSGDVEGAIGAYNYIYQAQKLGVNVVAVNNSWGVVESSVFNTIVQLVGENGAVSCFAAGNSAFDNDTYEDIIGSEPNPYLITVAATNEKDELADFSEYGKKTVTLGAPGTNILSSVATNCFNPTIYDAKTLEELCGAAHTGYESINVAPYTVDTEGVNAPKGAYVGTQEFGLPTVMIASKQGTKVDSNVTFEVADSNEQYFGLKGTKALKLTAKNAKKGDFITFAIPVETFKSEDAADISFAIKTEGPDAKLVYDSFWGEYMKEGTDLYLGYISEDAFNEGMEDNFGSTDATYILNIDGTANYWDHFVFQSVDKEANTEYLMLQVAATSDGDYTIYLDDVAATKGLKGEDDKFGKYDFYNGTSMATPYVTGAVALLSSVYPEAGADELVAIASGSVRASADLKDKTVTGGVLDLSCIDNPVPYISSVGLDGNKILVKGIGFKAGTKVKVNGAEVKADMAKDGKSLTFSADKFYNKKINVEVTNAKGTVSKLAYITNGVGYDYVGSLTEIADSSIFSSTLGTTTDGKNLYVIDDDGFGGIVISSVAVDGKNGEYTSTGALVSYFETAELFDYIEDGYISICVQGQPVYCDGNIYFLLSQKSSLSKYSEYKLAKIDVKTAELSLFGELPKLYDNISVGTLAAYNGNIYIIGGYDYAKETFATNVMKYSPKDNTWSKAPSLPEGRDLGQAVQVGDKLVYTLGAAKITDGKSSCPKAVIFDGSKWNVSKASLNALACEELEYNNGKKYAAYTACVGLCKDGVFMCGLAADGLGDSYIYNVAKDTYVASGYQHGTQLKAESFAGTVVGDKFIGLEPNLETGDATIVTAPVKSGLLKVTAAATKYGKLKTDKAGYLPGSVITVKATGSKGHTVTSLTVDGKKTKGTSVKFRITKDTKIKIGFGQGVTKIKLNKKTATLKVGKTLKLKATVSPKKAINKKVTWKTSNKKYATVSEKGVVKALKAGKGKTVTITCTAKDGTGVKATCKIKIK